MQMVEISCTRLYANLFNSTVHERIESEQMALAEDFSFKMGFSYFIDCMFLVVVPAGT